MVVKGRLFGMPSKTKASASADSSAAPTADTTATVDPASFSAKSSSGVPPAVPLLKHRRTQSLLSHYQTLPITKHYALTNQILAAFDSLYATNTSQSDLLAYALGLQFAEMALLEIPRHGYYYSSRHEKERLQSSYDALRVTDMLKNLVKSMELRDEQEEKEGRMMGKGMGDEKWKCRVNEHRMREREVSVFSKLAREHANEKTLANYDRDRDKWIKTRRAKDLKASSLKVSERECRRPSASSRGGGQNDDEQRLCTDWVFPDGKISGAGASEICGKIIDWGDSVTSVICPHSGTKGGTNVSPPTIPLPSTAATTTSSTKKQGGSTAPSPPPSLVPMMKSRTAPASSTKSRPSLLKGGDANFPWPPFSPLPEVSEIGTSIYPSTHAIQVQVGVPAKVQVGIPAKVDVGIPAEGPPPSSSPRSGRMAITEQHETEIDLERALFLSGLDVMPHSASPVTPPALNQETGRHLAQAGTVAPVISDASSGRMESDGAAVVLSPSYVSASSAETIDISTLCLLYHEDFDSLRNSNRVRIYYMDTYQGKHPGSVNGCTVIAPLLCIHHFHNDSSCFFWEENNNSQQQPRFLDFGLFGASGITNQRKGGQTHPDNGIPDAEIEEVIDAETPVILPEVRDKLGLAKDALIIPSDVHDYLLEQSLLSQNQFVSVCGGNVLDDKHLGEFVRVLMTADEDKKDNAFRKKKLAATFFFHEHVICIHKLRRGKRRKNGRLVEEEEVWFDLIDSLPNQRMLSKVNSEGSNKSRDGSCHGSSRRAELSWRDYNSGSDSDWYQSIEAYAASSAGGSQDFSLSGHDHQPCFGGYVASAVRIRCIDVESLQASLRWYSCAKFTEEDRRYINAYQWDDLKSDFDPRVFQAFIWAEA